MRIVFGNEGICSECGGKNGTRVELGDTGTRVCGLCIQNAVEHYLISMGLEKHLRPIFEPIPYAQRRGDDDHL